MSIKNEVHLSLARSEPTALVLLDLSAAFDTIDHNILLGYLKSWFGLGGTALRWLASYLRNRCQAIKIGSTLSELSNLIYGVPQGSVLGPLLFSLYTTPLSKIIRLHPHIKFHFYADDTQLYIHLSHKNASSALAKLNACLRDVQEWMSLSKLKLNPEITEFIVFGSKAQRQKISSHFPVSILGSLLHLVDSVRNLGVWFDADFSFSEHIKRTCKACFLQMRDLRRIRKYLTSEVAVLAANALVSSRLDYCNSLFRGLSGFNQHKLQSIQNTLARIVTNHRNYAHVTPILQKLHWLPVKYRYIFKTATLVYKFCIVVLLLTSNRSCLLVVVPIVLGIVTQIVNTLQFLLFIHQSLSQPNILAIVLPLMLLRSGMTSLKMFAVQHQLPPSERSLKLTCLQKPTHHSLSRHICVSLVRPGYVP